MSKKKIKKTKQKDKQQKYVSQTSKVTPCPTEAARPQADDALRPPADVSPPDGSDSDLDTG